jgi:peroxiredoxin
VQAQNKPFKVGQKFPSVTLKTIDGKTISPATLKKKPFWMTFFAAG